MIDRRALLGGGLAAVAACPAPAAALDRASVRKASVKAYPISSFSVPEKDRRVFGKLTFLGGLELKSKDPDFGGISSGVIDVDGKSFLVASDHAYWIAGRFTEQEGVLAGIEDVTIAPMIAPDGRLMSKTRYFDSEGMARRGNTVFISVERTHDILQFELGSRNFGARGKLLDVPAEMKTLDANRGVEALGVLPRESAYAGALIALAEKAPARASGPDNPGWIIGPKPGRLSVKKIGTFDITDLAFLPGGDMLILERRFSPFLGLGSRIRRIPIGMVKPGAVLDGEILFEADLSHQIDNMEVLMVHQDAQGRTIITLMSDDNFLFVQRNLVLRFAYEA